MRPRGMLSRWVKLRPWYFTGRRQPARAAERDDWLGDWTDDDQGGWDGYEDLDPECTMCGGEWYLQECDDPIQCCDPRCDGVWHPCSACLGTGEAKNQWCW